MNKSTNSGEKKIFKDRLYNFFGENHGVCFILIALAYLFVMFAFRYEDTVAFTSWSTEFWGSLFGGGLKHYYEYTLTNPLGVGYGAPQGSYLTFFPWIFWNFPLYILNRLTGINVGCTACVVWSKCFLLLCFVMMCVYEYKIIQRISKDNKELSCWVVLLTVGGLEFMNSIVYAGQDEIVYLCAFVISLYLYMTERKRSALIWAVVSVTICPIMVIPYLFVIVVYEDDFFKIVGSALLSVIPTFAFEFAYRNDEIYLFSKKDNTLGTFQTMMNTTTFPSAIGNVCIGGIVLIILAAFCFFVKKQEDKDRKIISALAIVFFCICFLMATTFYRSCIYIPFFAMFACLPTDNYPYRIVSLMLIEFGKFYKWLSHASNFNIRYLNGFLADRVHRGGTNGQLFNPATALYDSFMYIVRCLVFACVFFLFALYYRDKKISIKTKLPMKMITAIYSLIGIIYVSCFFVYFLR